MAQSKKLVSLVTNLLTIENIHGLQQACRVAVRSPSNDLKKTRLINVINVSSTTSKSGNNFWDTLGNKF